MYQVAIRKNETGEVRLATIKADWTSHSKLWWTGGNQSCDCSRHLRFERVGGASPDISEVECGDGKYSVLYALLPDGALIKIEQGDADVQEG